jgi:hypothetical protein
MIALLFLLFFSRLAANISVKLVPSTFINTYLVSQIPICKMESQILALKKAIGISNTNWYFECRLLLQIPIFTSDAMSNDPLRRRRTRTTATTATTTTTTTKCSWLAAKNYIIIFIEF